MINRFAKYSLAIAAATACVATSFARPVMCADGTFYIGEWIKNSPPKIGGYWEMRRMKNVKCTGTWQMDVLIFQSDTGGPQDPRAANAAKHLEMMAGAIKESGSAASSDSWSSPTGTRLEGTLNMRRVHLPSSLLTPESVRILRRAMPESFLPDGEKPPQPYVVGYGTRCSGGQLYTVTWWEEKGERGSSTTWPEYTLVPGVSCTRGMFVNFAFTDDLPTPSREGEHVLGQLKAVAKALSERGARALQPQREDEYPSRTRSQFSTIKLPRNGLTREEWDVLSKYWPGFGK